MSVNININFSGNGLLNNAKQQQSANRQAQLGREAYTRLETKATKARTKKLSIQGKDSKDNPLNNVPVSTPNIDRRPAAHRLQDITIGQSWLFNGNEGVEGGIAGDIEYPAIRYTGYWNDTYGPGSGYGVPTYGVGPAPVIRDPIHTYHVGCGDGSKWLNFTFGLTGMPEFPAPDYEVVDSWSRAGLHGVGDPFSGTVTISKGYSVQHLENPVFSDYLVLPVKKDRHILLFYGRFYFGYDIEFGYYWHSTITAGYDSRRWSNVLPWRLSGTDNVPSLTGRVASIGEEIVELDFSRFPPEYRFEYWNMTGSLGSQATSWYPDTGSPPDAPSYPDADLGILSVESRYGYSKICKAFLVSKNNVKELSVPASVQQWIEEITNEEEVELEVINPVGATVFNEDYLFRGSPNYAGGGLPYPVARYKKIPVDFSLIKNGAEGFLGNGNSVAATPDIYRKMNEALPFISTSLIKQFPANEPWLLENLEAPGVLGEYLGDAVCYPHDGPEFEGAYRSFYDINSKFYYAKWGTKGEEPEYAYFDEDCWEETDVVNPYPPIKPIRKPNILSGYLRQRPGIPVADDSPRDYLSSHLNASYDGEDAAYCRKILLAFGFSPEDLNFDPV